MDTYSLGWWNPLSVTNEKSWFCGCRRNSSSPSALHCSEWPSLSSLGGRECGVYVSEKEVVGTSGPGLVDKLDVAVVCGVLWRRPHQRLEDEWEDLSNNTQAPSTGTCWQSLQRSMLASARSSLSLSPSSFFLPIFYFTIFLMCDLLVFVVFLVLFFVLCPCRLCSARLSFHKRTWLSMQGWTAAPGIVIRPSMIKSNNFQLLFQAELFIKDPMKLWGRGQHLCWWHSPSSREWLHYRGTHQGLMVIVMSVWFSFLVGEPWTCLWW